MAFDGIITKSIATELNRYIVGCKVNKIYKPTRQDLVFNLYGNGQNYDLAICTNGNFSRVHLTKYSKPNPITAPNFCMFLRKHLTGAKILSVSSYDLERIISISFEAYNELNDKINKTLYIEIMGQFSNVILVNENGTILDCLNHVVTKTRELLPVRPYEFPANSKNSFIDINFDDFFKLVSDNFSSSIDKTLSDLFIGISRSFIQNLCGQLNIDLSVLAKENMKIIYDCIKNILAKINDLEVACFKTDNLRDYFLNVADNSATPVISDFLDEFYYEKEQCTLFTTYRDYLLNFLLSTLNKYKKRLVHINDKLADCENMEHYRLYGELLTANLYKFKSVCPNSIEVLNYYDNTNITIPLDSSISPSKNVERYYKKFNKCKNTLVIVSKQKLQTEEELKYIESLIYSIQDCKTLSDLEEIGTEISESFDLSPFKGSTSSSSKAKEQKSSPKKYEVNGFTVYVGKNNKQNDLLTKSANKEDMWFHTQQIHGSHVILKTEGKKVDYDTILKCASIAATNSKAKNSNNVPVDYTFVKYVRKPSGSKPGKAIYTHYKTVFVN